MSGKILEHQNAKKMYSHANKRGCIRQLKVLEFVFLAVFCCFMSFSPKLMLIFESHAGVLRGNNRLSNSYCHNIVMVIYWLQYLPLIAVPQHVRTVCGDYALPT